MTITEEDVQNIDLAELTSFMTQGSTLPIMGGGFSPGQFTGQPFSTAQSSVCAMWHWIRDNAPFLPRLRYDFESKSDYWIDLFSKELDGEGQLVSLNSIGPIMITGRVSGAGDLQLAHVAYVRLIFKALGEWVEARL